MSIVADDNTPIAIAEAQGLSVGKAATQLNFELSSLDASVTELKLAIDPEVVIDKTSETANSYVLTLPKLAATATPVHAPGPTHRPASQICSTDVSQNSLMVSG